MRIEVYLRPVCAVETAVSREIRSEVIDRHRNIQGKDAGAVEGVHTDPGDAEGDRDIGQRLAVQKRAVIDHEAVCRKMHGFKRFAVEEAINRDHLERIGKHDVLQRRTVFKRGLADQENAVRQRHRRQRFAVRKGAFADFYKRGREGDRRKVGTIIKCVFADAGESGRQHDAFNTGGGKGVAPYDPHRFGDHKICQIFGRSKRANADDFKMIRKNKLGQSVQTVKCGAPYGLALRIRREDDALDAVPCLRPITLISLIGTEREFCDLLHRGGNRKLGKIAACGK